MREVVLGGIPRNSKRKPQASFYSQTLSVLRALSAFVFNTGYLNETKSLVLSQTLSVL